VAPHGTPILTSVSDLRPDTSGPVLQVDGLVRIFGDLRAVDGLSFEVAPAQIVTVLGPNGAG